MKHFFIIFLLVLSSCASVTTSRFPAAQEDSCIALVSSFLETTSPESRELVAKAKNLLGINLNRDQRMALWKAHKVGENELGRDGLRPAGIGANGETNYTISQLKLKTKILRDAKFDHAQIKSLFDEALAGENRYEGLTPAQIKKLDEQEKIFKESVAPTISKYTMVMPDNPEVKYYTFYKGIRDLLDSPLIVFERLKDLEIEILRRKNLNPNATIKQLLIDVLNETEARHGFKPAIDLKNQSYTNEEFWEMLRGGALFRDVVFNNGSTSVGDRSRHGEFTHRIQWYAVMRELELNPGRFKDGDLPLPTVAQVFAHLGDENLNAKVKIEGKDLWFRLFDSFSGTMHQPEFFHNLHGNWEGILWE